MYIFFLSWMLINALTAKTIKQHMTNYMYIILPIILSSFQAFHSPSCQKLRGAFVNILFQKALNIYVL